MADDKLPRLSYELIEYLDQDVPSPPWPATALGCAAMGGENQRKLVFLAGQRYMVDVLVGLMNEELRGEGDEGSPGSPPLRFARLLSPDGGVHSTPISETVELEG
jgi:hypothetical protein